MNGAPKTYRLSALGYLATLLVLVLAVAACGDSGPGSEQVSVLNRGNGAEPESLDMHKHVSTEAGNVLRDLGEGLVGYSPGGDIVAAAAEGWAISDDGLEYTFRLRPNARWSNGEPVTAEDFAYSLRRLVDPETAAQAVNSASGIANAEQILAGEMAPDTLGVEAIGEHELKIRLKQPIPYFLGMLTHPTAFPVHRASIVTHGSAHTRPGNHVSNGAYKLRERQVGSFIGLVRNEHYWNNAETNIDQVMHYVTPDPVTELSRYRAGELDITSTIPPESFAQMKQQRPGEVRTSPSLGVYYYGFNMGNPLFADNPKLREALSLAIDRETIANDVMGRGEKPAYGWVPDGIANYEPRRFSYANLSQTERQARAKQLFREAGFSEDPPLTIELRYNTSNVQQRIAASVQGMWKEVLGVETTLKNETFQVLLANIAQKEGIEVFRLNWTTDYNDAHSFLSILESDNPSNLTGYQSAGYDSLMRDAAAQTDPDLREAFLAEAESVLLNDHPLLPVYFYVNRSMVSKRVKGWGDNMLNYHYSQHLRLN